MASTTRAVAESGIYHAMMRGVEKRVIFADREDYARYEEVLADTTAATGVTVLAHVLMPNHVHLLVEDLGEALSAYFRRLGSVYARWFNGRHGRVGHLFQGRFRSIPVDTPEYLAAVVRYIHRNPAKAGLVAQPSDYRWSSRSQLDGGPGPANLRRLTSLLPADYIRALDRSEEADQDDAVRLAVQAPRRGRPSRFAPQEADIVFGQAVRVRGAETFDALPFPAQHDVVRELHVKGMAMRDIIRLTGRARQVLIRYLDVKLSVN
ncbi:MAG: transposase [Bifidobacteriaceae bacterium]|jgi:REP element-mobilizing transposase RayT|nr:transposase [Bifidobacteriaceae bacterium]